MNFIEYYKYNKNSIIKQFNEMNCDFTNLSGLLELFKNANKMLLDLSHFDTSNQEVFYDFIEELKSRLCDGPILESFDEHSVIWYGTEIGQKVFYKTDPRILDIAWKNYKIAYLWLEQMKRDYNHFSNKIIKLEYTYKIDTSKTSKNIINL